jgi:hypothetical protein
MSNRNFEIIFYISVCRTPTWKLKIRQAFPVFSESAMNVSQSVKLKKSSRQKWKGLKMHEDQNAPGSHRFIIEIDDL